MYICIILIIYETNKSQVYILNQSHKKTSEYKTGNLV